MRSGGWGWGGVGGGGGGGGREVLITGVKNAFENKLHYSTGKNMS